MRQLLEKGEHKSQLHTTWVNIKQRCSNKNTRSYKNYGGRGIKVCSEWSDYRNFKKWALANGYKERLSIERLDVNKGYEPGNCTWIPLGDQASNKLNTLRLESNGEVKTLKEWAKETGLNYTTVFSRFKRGWGVEKILSKTIRPK